MMVVVVPCAGRAGVCDGDGWRRLLWCGSTSDATPSLPSSAAVAHYSSSHACQNQLKPNWMSQTAINSTHKRHRFAIRIQGNKKEKERKKSYPRYIIISIHSIDYD